MNTSLCFVGGSVVERLMRNRGRIRERVASWNLARLLERMRRFDSGSWSPSSGRPTSNYAISLTSWTARLDELQLTLLTLIDQDVRPSAIHVWLTDDDLALLPGSRRGAFEAHGVRFNGCPDYRSHKKWLPLILAGREEPFVVCDDDIFYPREWFGRLVAEDRDDAYVGCKCHRMRVGAGGLPVAYAEWARQIKPHAAPSIFHFTTGCGGEILHPDRLDERALDWEAIVTHAPFSDDVWLKAAHLAAGVPVYKSRYSFPVLELPGTGETGLHLNHNHGKKDGQIRDAWKYFGIAARHFQMP